MKKKRLMKILKVTALVLVVVIVLTTAFGAWFITRPWPKISGNLKVKGLQSEVAVKRDKWGIPQIYAENKHDLIFAQGYVHAQDRLFQMELGRRIGMGTVSEMVGEPGLDMDRQSRTFGLRRVAEKSLPMLDKDTQEVLNAYCEGINAYIDTHKSKLPLEFTILKVKPAHWTPLEVLSWGNMLALNNALNYSYELFRAQLTLKLGDKMANDALPPWDNNNPLIVTPELEKYQWLKNSKITGVMDMEEYFPGSKTFGWASGAWVVSGKHTQTGQPILASDVHMTLSMPSLWYEIGLHGGGYDVAGFSLPGTPLVLIGHNSNIAWAFINMNADVEDLYIEKVNDLKNPTKYEYMGQWYDITKKTEVINIKGKNPYSLELLFTRHGPIMNDFIKITDNDKNNVKNYSPDSGNWSPLMRERWEGTEPVALRWNLQDRCIVFESIRKLNLAKNWEDFCNALKDWDSLSQNFVYGDIDGNIGYHSAGRVPIRAKNHQGIVPVSGWTGENEWQGYIPFDELPSLYNPPTGYVAVVNNKTVGNDYKYNISYDWFHPGYRARRVNELLDNLIASGRKVTAEDMSKIQADNYSYADKYICPYIEPAVKPANELEKKALEQIKSWNYSFDNDSTGGAIYKAWYYFMDRNVFDDELEKNNVWGIYFPLKRTQALVQLIPDTNNSWFDDVRTAQTENRDDMVRKSFTQAVNWLSKEYGSDVSRWNIGRIQTASLRHQIFGNVKILKNFFNSSKEPPFSGSPTSIAFSYSFCNPPGKMNIEFAANQRQIIHIGNWDDMLGVNSTGASGHLFNKHREDQMDMWAKCEYHSMPFSEKAVTQNAKDVLHLKPVKQ